MTKSPRRQDLPDIPPLIHQALLNPLLQEEELLTLCDAAKQLGFGGVCVSLIHLEAVRRRLGGQGPVTLIATVAFPFGALPAELKQAQAGRMGCCPWSRSPRSHTGLVSSRERSRQRFRRGAGSDRSTGSTDDRGDGYESAE